MKFNFKENKWLLAFVIACVLLAVAVTAIVILATRPAPQDEGPDVFIGDQETVMYYYDTVDGEVLLTFTGGNVFTLVGPGVNKTGTFAIADGNVTLDFVRDEDGTTTGKLVDQTLSLTYQGASMTFLKKTTYKVSFSCDGQVTMQIVVNGKSALQPADPVKEGYVFLGWYADEALTVPYQFGADLITADATLYAKLVPTVAGQNEYTVDFVLGYEGAEAPEAVKTVGGKLYALPAQPERDGYTFCGWWISMTENGEKLTCRYTDGMVFSADTTLFALWAQETGSKLQAPNVSVTNAGANWDAVNGASGYHIVITDAAGTVVMDKDLGATTENVDFAAMAAGEYRVEVTAVAPNTANNSDAAVRYYTNKGLDRVSQFQVIDGVLAFNAVAHAEKYYITIQCGNPAHNHTNFDNGSSTSFFFGNCSMQPGGIKITVTAAANGYADSVSETFVFDRTLASVENVTYDDKTDAFVWSRVENATGYTVTVTVGGQSYTFALGNTTTFSAAAYTGDITVAVIPVTEGYNSPAASTAACNKVVPATPSGLKVNGMVLSWDAAMGAESYEVKIGNQTFTANTTSLDLAAAGANITAGQMYEVCVKSFAGGESSAYSEVANMGYQVMNTVLSYSCNTVYWTPVIGVNNYEIRVNGVVVASVSDTNCAKIRLTKAGINLIEVRFTDNGGSQWASIEVNAFKVTYNSRSLGGEEVEYVAIGDMLSMPDHFTNSGYTFAGWYNSPAASQGNGKKIESNIFTGNADTVYYADWTPDDYNVTMQVEGYELTNIEQGQNFKVTYTHAFVLPVPESSNPVYTSFVGWFTGPSGSGTKLTDANGVSVAPFSTTHDVTAYPFFDTNILSFELDSDGTYEVKAGPNIDNVTSVTIPYTYGGIPVTTILESAFNGCNNLREVNIPDTIELVGSSAFSGAANLESIHVYAVSGNHDIYYSSHEGVLIRHDMGSVFIDSVPRAKTGTFEIPEYVGLIQSKTFQLSNLSKVIISKNVEVIYEKAFYRCEKLEAVEFAGGRTTPVTLDISMFYSCPNITYIKLPANINQFSTDIFGNLKKLDTIDVEPGGTMYGSVDGMLTNALEDTILYVPKTLSGSFTVPKGIQYIGASAFAGCTGLTAITIPNYVKSIGANAFADCTRVKSVTFEGGRKNDLTIENRAFAGCATLDTVTFHGSNDGTLEKGAITIGSYAFAPATEGEKRLRTVAFRDGVNVTAIGSYAFANQSALYSLTFGQNIRVEEIGASAFSGDSLIPTLSIPATTLRIGDSAFKNCTGITTVTFAEGGNEVQFGNGAFSGCSRITQINLPATLVDFNGSVFKGCDLISQINVASNSPYLTSENGVLYSKDYTSLLYYPKALDADWATLSKLRWDTITTIGESVFEENTKVTSFIIMPGVTTIGTNAFYNCTNLQSLTYQAAEAGQGKHLTIGNKAFSGCKKLATVSIPDYTTSIGNDAFRQNSFASFVMPSAVTTIGSAAFRGNTKLAAITITASITSVGSGAFYGCTALAEVTFVEGGSLLTLGTVAGEGVFQGCLNLTAIDMKNRVTVVGGHAFQSSGIRNNANTTGLVLGSNVTQIGNQAFASTKSLLQITIPAGVTSIGSGAFSGSALNKIEFEAGGTAALTIGADAFQNTSLTSITFPARTAVLSREVSITGGAKAPDIAEMFTGVDNLKNIHVEAGCAKYCSIDGVLYELDENGQPAILLLCPVKNAGTVVDGVASGELIIPNTVTQVASRALRDIRVLHTVTFEEFDKTDERYGTQRLTLGPLDTAVSVGVEYAAIGGLDTNTITTVNLPSHMSFFNGHAIAVTKDVVAVNINPDATEIVLGRYAFYGSRITSLVISGVKSMETLVFSGCKDIQALAFGDKSTITTLPQNAFNGVEIKSFVVPASVTTMDSQAFFFAKKLESVSFAEGSQLSYMGGSVFNGCESLVNLDLSNVTKLKTIGNSCFNQTKIKSFTFPESIESAGTGMFWQCAELTDIYLPASFTAAMLFNGNETIFDEAPALRAIHVAEGNLELSSEDGVLYDRIKTIVYCYPVARPLQNYQIPETVRVIERAAFRNFTGTELALPANLERIEAFAFESAKITSYVIPAGVTSIGASAFAQDYSNNTHLTSVVFAPGSKLTSIGERAFYCCAGLTEIVIPDSVATIGAYAFAECSNIKSVILPAALTEVSNCLFMNCYALRDVILQQGVTQIGSQAFRETLLASIEIPSSVRIIADNAFKEMTKLSVVTIKPGSAMESVGASAFEGCMVLQSINLPDSVKTIGAKAFKGDGNLKHFTIPANLTEIPESMLDGCKLLPSIVIPAKVTSIGNRAFANNASIDAIQIPAAVATVGTSAFEGCSSAKEIEFADGSAVKELGSDVTGKDNIFKGTTSAQTLKLPAGLTFIGGHVFEGCGVKTLSIPNSVVEIGAYAFADCDNIKTVSISGTVSYLGDYAFFDCDSLKTANLSLGVEYLGTLVFGFCEKLTEAYIPATVIRIGSNPFAGCVAAGDVQIDPENENFLVEDGIIYDLSKTILYSYPASRTDAAFEIPATVTTVAAGAFAGSQLQTVVFPQRLQTIEPYTFADCKKLTSVTIEQGITAIGDGAFRGCSALNNVTVPASAVNLGDYAFADCSVLSNFTFAGSNTYYIGTHFFENCISMTKLTLPAKFSLTEEDADQYGLLMSSGKLNSSAAQAIPSYMFAGTGLVNVEIPSTVKWIGTDGVFMNCKYMKSVKFKSSNISCKYIGNYYFYGCSSLTELTIPRGATAIFSNSVGYSFAYCTALKSITINYGNLGALAPASSGHMFEGCTSLTSITFKGLGTAVAYMDYVGPYYFAGCTSLKSLMLAEYASICEYAFKDCTALFSLDFDGMSSGKEATLALLGDYAFAGCTGNGGLMLPKLAGYIGTNVFDGWTASEALKTYESKEEVMQLLSTGIFKGCKAVIYEKDFNIIEIDPETGLPKNP